MQASLRCEATCPPPPPDPHGGCASCIISWLIVPFKRGIHRRVNKKKHAGSGRAGGSRGRWENFIDTQSAPAERRLEAGQNRRCTCSARRRSRAEQSWRAARGTRGHRRWQRERVGEKIRCGKARRPLGARAAAGACHRASFVCGGRCAAARSALGATAAAPRRQLIITISSQQAFGVHNQHWLSSRAWYMALVCRANAGRHRLQVSQRRRRRRQRQRSKGTTVAAAGSAASAAVAKTCGGSRRHNKTKQSMDKLMDATSTCVYASRARLSLGRGGREWHNHHLPGCKPPAHKLLCPCQCPSSCSRQRARQTRIHCMCSEVFGFVSGEKERCGRSRSSGEAGSAKRAWAGCRVQTVPPPPSP